MAEGGKGAPQTAEQQRAEQGSYVAALNAYAVSLSADDRSDLGLLEPKAALQSLAAAVRDGTLRIPRLFVLDSLVRLADRRGADLHGNAALDELLTALVERAGDPTVETAASVSTTRDALDAVRLLGGADSDGERWATFAQQAGPSLHLTQAEVDKPLCNDWERVHKGNSDAIAITVEFHTDAAPGDLRHFCDPTRWYECSAYQEKMTPWDGVGAISVERPNGWRRDLYETVRFSGTRKLVTPLRFTYSIQADVDPSWVHLDYVLLNETTDIVVDEGALDVRRVVAGKYKGRTRVTAKKAILFVDPILREWSTIACDTFWTDMVIATAVGCPNDGGSPPTQIGAKMGETKTDKLDKAIEEAKASAQESVTVYADLAKEAAAQLAGGAPTDAGTWLQLTAKTWAQAAGDTANAWMAYNKVLGILADQTGSTPTPTGPTPPHPGPAQSGPTPPAGPASGAP